MTSPTAAPREENTRAGHPDHITNPERNTMTTLIFARRAIEADGTTHAARYAGSLRHFTTACAVYPAPEVDRLDASSAREVTCEGCRTALAAAGGSR